MANNEGNAGQSTSTTIARVAVKIPPFWEKNPVTWFQQLDSQFELAGVTQDITKYHHVVGNLESRYADVVMDIINSPPETGKYDSLRRELINRLSASKEQKLRQLLEHESLGDRKPTVFLRHLQGLAGESVTQDLLKTIWMGRLPNHVQTILISRPKDNLQELATLADSILDLTTDRHVSAVHSADKCEILQQISDLQNQIAQLSTRRARSSSRFRKRSRSTSANKRDSKGEVVRNADYCWYHQKFGSKARGCKSPCSFSKN